MVEFRFSWVEKWEATIEAKTFEEAQEKFSNLDRLEMGFCGSEQYEVTVSEGDMVSLTEGNDA